MESQGCSLVGPPRRNGGWVIVLAPVHERQGDLRQPALLSAMIRPQRTSAFASSRPRGRAECCSRGQAQRGEDPRSLLLQWSDSAAPLTNALAQRSNERLRLLLRAVGSSGRLGSRRSFKSTRSRSAPTYPKARAYMPMRAADQRIACSISTTIAAMSALARRSRSFWLSVAYPLSFSPA